MLAAIEFYPAVIVTVAGVNANAQITVALALKLTCIHESSQHTRLAAPIAIFFNNDIGFEGIRVSVC